ncbi:MAG: hypothetical protein H7Y42_12350 [Chitinophagaceae bacterium]|nr:hypothetical protein [Chitinophagaceae bacterium]
MDAELVKYLDHLISTMEKSHQSFEKQMSFISSGALALSVGFNKNVVPHVVHPNSILLLFGGWILLTVTLVLSCIFHLRTGQLHNRTIKEIHEGSFKRTSSIRRIRTINTFNWFTAITMVLGIVLIVAYVIVNHKP